MSFEENYCFSVHRYWQSPKIFSVRFLSILWFYLKRFIVSYQTQQNKPEIYRENEETCLEEQKHRHTELSQ